MRQGRSRRKRRMMMRRRRKRRKRRRRRGESEQEVPCPDSPPPCAPLGEVHAAARPRAGAVLAAGRRGAPARERGAAGGSTT
eukprot:8044609-Pyramimonas_sp.AAC.1